MSDHELPILRRELARHRAISATMLAALIAVANDPNTPADLRGMAFAVIAQAEAAGIKVEDQP
jgi:uncharacterized protein (UPF0147 family)